MRPSVLDKLFAPITTLPGIGPRMAPLYAKLAGERVVDLLWHFPSGLIDRRHSPRTTDAQTGQVVTLTLTVLYHDKPSSSRRPYRIHCLDGDTPVTLVYFHAKEDWLLRLLPPGEQRVVSGTIDRFQDEFQITHPDHVVPLAERDQIMTIEPVHPLTGGLTERPLSRAIEAALERCPDLPEWQNPAWLAKNHWKPWLDSLKIAHHPQTVEAVEDSPERRRLAYDELLANQLALMLVRNQMRTSKGRPLAASGELRQRVMESLPFTLTKAQQRVLTEIDADMSQPIRMLRLLQGDVGSGKTVVALLSMCSAIEAGAQAALMAPTEILARQHYATIKPLAEAVGLQVRLLTGRDKGKARDSILADLADGTAHFALGTHALFQKDVQFKDLALAVIDEQHRFGVQQRLDLTAKGRAVDVLAMTATPIPRTLMLTAYGDMDASRLDERPPGRKPVDTRILPLERFDEIVTGLHRPLAAQARVYWICPLVEENEDLDLAAAVERARVLEQFFPAKVGLVHGKLKSAEKDRVMAAFQAGNLDILVATTVVEVGVDVPEATIMIIEHAERFGLSQLHQLRGRVGRGDRASSCLLLYGHPLSDAAKKRLEVMRATDDGFVIAEEDLLLRGGGEVLGTKQSGLPEFKIADLTKDGDLLNAARDDSKLIVNADPDLTTPRGQTLRTLLYLFDRDAAVKTLRSG